MQLHTSSPLQPQVSGSGKPRVTFRGHGAALLLGAMSPIPSPVRLAENIALLSLLKPDPANASCHLPPVAGPRASPRMSLSATKERHLAKTLAFLAGFSADHRHVTAVAIE